MNIGMVRLLSLWLAIMLNACQVKPSSGLQSPPVLHPDPRLRGSSITWYKYGKDMSAAERTLLDRFTADTGIRVKVIPFPVPIPEAYASYQQVFKTRRADLDVFSVDIIWTKAFAPYLVDLRPALGAVARDHFPDMIRNNTVGGRLIGIPFVSNVGALYYRTDLLKKYGFRGPPTTWEDLERMAKTIQAGERAHNPEFTGFVWPGAAEEALTNDGLEWQVSHGGGQILNPRTGAIEVNNPRAIAAFKRAAGWLGTISPPGLRSFSGDDAFDCFMKGNAAFARLWIASWGHRQYLTANAPGSPIRSRFDITVLPHARGPYPPASSRGEWQLGVSIFSKKREAAIEFVGYMTSYAVQRWRAMNADLPPTIPALYRDPEVLRTEPYLKTVGWILDRYAVARPSWQAGVRYNELSRLYFEGVGAILQGKDVSHAVATMERDIRLLLNSARSAPSERESRSRGPVTGPGRAGR
jgi:trehalose/maltose transport system substrate-binding protein